MTWNHSPLFKHLKRSYSGYPELTIWGNTDTDTEEKNATVRVDGITLFEKEKRY